MTDDKQTKTAGKRLEWPTLWHKDQAGTPVGEFEAAAQAAQREYPECFADNANEFTGKLYRGEHDGTVRGWLIDRMGFRIEFVGFKDPRSRAGGGYIIIGRLAHIPEHLRQEAID